MRVLLDGKLLAKGYRPRAEVYTLNARGEFVDVPNNCRPTIQTVERLLKKVSTPPLHRPTGEWRLIPYGIWTASVYLYFGVDQVGATRSQIGELIARRPNSALYDWEFSWDSNEGCVLLDTVDICRLLKLDTDEILGEDAQCVDQFYDHFRARKPKANEAALVADALEDINFHSICGRLRDAIG